LSALASHKVNGVSALHSQLMVDTIFSGLCQECTLSAFATRPMALRRGAGSAQANPALV
jgi:hypothetical protein